MTGANFYRPLKPRQFAELNATRSRPIHALYIGEHETFEETLRRLGYDRAIPRKAADVY